MKEKKIAQSPDFLTGGGVMGDLIRNFDWSATPLGAPQQWSASLKSVVSLMLVNRFPMLLWWGKDYVQFYNDYYIPIPALKHPRALGQTARECWAEIWEVLRPLVDTPFKGGPATWMDDLMVQMNRNNFTEETHFIIAYSAVPDPTAPNGIGGVLATVTEITEGIISKRQMETLRQLGKEISSTLSENEVYAKSTGILVKNQFDAPFAFIHRIQAESSTAVLEAAAGIGKDFFGVLSKIDLKSDETFSRKLAQAVYENSIIHSDVPESWKDLPKGAWDRAPQCLAHIPVNIANRKVPQAVVTVALNPYRKFDESYRNFVGLFTDQVSLGVNNALAYEEERKKAQILEELDKAKTVFFSNISHEFRTPLTLMLGTLEESMKDPNNNSENAERLAVAHRNAMRLLKLVNTLLDFSRIESGRQMAKFNPVDLSSFTRNIASNFRSIVEKVGLSFNVDTTSLSRPVYIDKQMWEKIVFNLLSNAFKYTLNGSISVKLYSENNHAVLKVIDTGTGIPEKEMPSMFQRFHRVQNSTGRTFEGTGIGLSLIKEFVNLHGGDISVQSKEGDGSTFSVTVPFGKSHLPADQISEMDSAVEELISSVYLEEATSLIAPHSPVLDIPIKTDSLNHTAKILVVDDNADMRQHLKSLLQRHYSVETAVNGLDALHKVNAEKPSLLISDIMMPVMDGMQLLKELKQNPKTANVPVILLTARAGEESRIQGLEMGADDYLVKPFSSNELLARIKAQIQIAQSRFEIEGRLKGFLMQTPAAIAVFEGPDQVITIANRLFQDMFQRSETELIGKTIRQAFPELEGQGYIETFDRVFRTGEPFVAYASPAMIIKNGVRGIGYYDYVVQPVKNKEGKTTELLAFGVDVTSQVEARKRIENISLELEMKVKERTEELESSQSFLQQVIDSSVEFVSVLDKNLKYITVNRKFEDVMGISRDEVKGKGLFDISPISRDTVQHQCIQKALQGEITHLDRRKSVARPDYFVDTYFAPLRVHGQVEGVIIMARDVTEIAKSEMLLARQNEELERINKELESFNYIASHDLQEPLRKIQTFIHLVRQGKDKESTGQYLSKIEISARRMSQLIQSVLDYSRLSQPAGAFEDTDLNEVIENVKVDYEFLLNEKKAKVIAKKLPVIRAVPHQLQQVFSNLFSNSLKFSSEKPIIRIEAKTLKGTELKFSPEGIVHEKYVKIKFSDNGIGFDQKYSKQIFKLFQRLHNKSEYSGTGVGLSIVSKIIDHHKGYIEASSETGKGATFTIWLPMF